MFADCASVAASSSFPSHTSRGQRRVGRRARATRRPRCKKERAFRGEAGLGEDEDSVHAAHWLSLWILKLVGKPSRLLLMDLRQACATCCNNSQFFHTFLVLPFDYRPNVTCYDSRSRQFGLLHRPSSLLSYASHRISHGQGPNTPTRPTLPNNAVAKRAP
jgi:hypothetical protein